MKLMSWFRKLTRRVADGDPHCTCSITCGALASTSQRHCKVHGDKR